MPAGILQGDNAKEVAAFVGAYAGQLGDDAGPARGHATTVEKPDPPRDLLGTGRPDASG